VDIDPAGTARAPGGPTRDELLREFGTKAEALVLGVDRMDYTKGIVERLMAFERMLEEHPYHHERVTMVQVAAPSRTRIPSYIDLRRNVEAMAERINTRFGTASWRPVVLIQRQANHEEVTTWYRAADVCLVTSLHDGMNLVAKEYLAAREDGDGVLVLSKFTGAAVELRDALIVNPYDMTVSPRPSTAPWKCPLPSVGRGCSACDARSWSTMFIGGQPASWEICASCISKFLRMPRAGAQNRSLSTARMDRTASGPDARRSWLRIRVASIEASSKRAQ